MPPTERCAVQVDRRGEQDVDPLTPRLGGEQPTKPGNKTLVPALTADANGPSDRSIDRRPIVSSAWVVQKLDPVTRRTLPRRSSKASRRSIASSRSVRI
jgi:hypothetical protein